jgi:heparanase 1
MFRSNVFLAAPLLMGGFALAQGTITALSPATMRSIGSVDPRYQSYNLEMVEVMGGKWWAPYGTPAPAAAGKESVSGNVLGSSPFRYQSPIDLTNPRLRKLAAALGPAYIRVSDTWANTMYFQDSNAVTPGPAPAGFGAVLTGPEWKGVIDFSKGVDAKLVTSFSIGTGVRDANGVWTPAEAEKIMAFTKKQGGSIAAAEFFNEPNMAAIEGAPKGYDAAAYGQDFKVFRAFANARDPQMKILGPGPVGEGRVLGNLPAGIKTEDMLRAEGPGLDAFSYHFYGAVSQRCQSMGKAFQTTPEAALTRDWLFATDAEAAFYGNLRDRYVPGKPLWLSETSEAACGGNPWAADFLDSFRYLNQLGTLAQAGVQVVMHNTLIGSDYGLIDQDTLVPRPNYWTAVLWHRLMGTTVLDNGTAPVANLYIYAQCLANQPGGVALLAINADTTAEQRLEIPDKSKRFTLSAPELQGREVQLNGRSLSLTGSGNLPTLQGAPTARGTAILKPATITFFAISNANNQSCR